MRKSTLFDFLNGYEEAAYSTGSSKSEKSFFVRKYSGSLSHHAKKFSSNPIYKFFLALSRRVTFTSSRTFGAAALTFGILTLVFHFTTELFEMYETNTVTSLIIGILSSVLSVPFLITDRPLSVLAGENALTSYVFFDFLCMRKVYYTGTEKGIPIYVGAILGIIPVAIAFFIPTWAVLLGITALAVVYIAFLSPEFGFFVSLILLPYMSYIPYSTEFLLVIIAVAMLSFLRKTVFGKRILNLEQYDLFVILFMLAILLSGLYNGTVASFGATLEFVVFALGYMIVSNVVTNRRLCDRTISAVALSSVPVALVSFVTVFSALADGTVRDRLSEGVKSTFESTDTLAAFLIVAIIFAVILIKQSHGGLRALYTAVMVLDVFALAISGELFALFALLLSIGAYFALRVKRFSGVLLLVLAAVPYTIFLLPDVARDKIFELLPTNLTASETLALWRECLASLREHVFLGMGVGSSSFADEISGFLDAENLFLGLALEAGCIAFAIFVLMLAVRLRHRAHYMGYIKGTEIGTAEPLIETAMFALLAYGATDFLWSDGTMFYLFIVVFGLGSATLRIAKKEHDDRTLYYRDIKQHDFSVLDIHIR